MSACEWVNESESETERVGVRVRLLISASAAIRWLILAVERKLNISAH